MKHSDIDFFADDTTVHTASSSLSAVENDLNSDIVEIKNWCDEN